MDEQEPQEVSCDICGKKFSSKESLMQHKADAHKTSEQPVKTKNFKIGKFLPYVIGIVILIGIVGIGIWAFSSSSGTQVGAVGSTHIHTDFALYLDGQQITPLSTRYFVRSPYVHVESGPGEGTVIHMHATNVPLNMFFKSLGMDFNADCFKLDNGNQFCNSEKKTLKMFVKHSDGEWERNYEFEKYIFKDLDKILISYGNETADQIKTQQNSVTNFSKANSGVK